MFTFIWWHVSNAIVVMARILPLSIYPHVVGRLGLPPHCATLDDYRETRDLFSSGTQPEEPDF